MRLNEGVEWALHCCLNLAWVGEERAVPAAKLAAFFELPAPYLNKQLQALARAGIVSSTPGPRGGFRLDRDPGRVSLLDVVVAIEGPDDAFRCTQILHQAPFGDQKADYTVDCALAKAMSTADLAWRKELAAKSIADIANTVERTNPGSGERVRRWFTDA